VSCDRPSEFALSPSDTLGLPTTTAGRTADWAKRHKPLRWQNQTDPGAFVTADRYPSAMPNRRPGHAPQRFALVHNLSLTWGDLFATIRRHSLRSAHRRAV
jgi:hypothetical protein